MASKRINNAFFPCNTHQFAVFLQGHRFLPLIKEAQHPKFAKSNDIRFAVICTSEGGLPADVRVPIFPGHREPALYATIFTVNAFLVLNEIERRRDVLVIIGNDIVIGITEEGFHCHFQKTFATTQFI